MSAATIPLMGVSPLQAYSQMLNLGALQQDQRQQAQMAPYKLQEAQNQVQLGQMQVQAQQIEAAKQAKIAQITADVFADPNTRPASPAPPPSTTPAAPPATAGAAPSQPATPPPATATPQGLGAMGASPTPSPAAPPANLTDPVDGQQDSDSGVADAAAAAQAQPAASLDALSASPPTSASPTAANGSPTVAPTVPPTPPRQITPEEAFTQRMTAAGLADRIAPVLQARAAARTQKDQGINEYATKYSGGDPDKWYALASNEGMSPEGLAAHKQALDAMVEQGYKRLISQSAADKAVEDDANRKRDLATDKISHWNDRPDDDSPEGRKANFADVLSGLQRDKLVSPETYTSLLKQTNNGETVPDRDQTKVIIDNVATKQWIDAHAAELGKQVVTAASQLAGSRTYADYANAKAALPPTVAKQFPDFQAANANAPMSDADRQIARAPGLTPEQQTTAAATAAKNAREATDKQRELAQGDTRNKIAQQRTNQGQERVNAGNASQHTLLIKDLADQARNDSDQNGGSGDADALKNVNNSGFYQGTDTGKYRSEVAAELQRRINPAKPKGNSQASGVPQFDANGNLIGAGSNQGGNNQAANSQNQPAPAPPKGAPQPPPPPTGGFNVQLSPDLQKVYGGKKYLHFKDQETANKFAAEIGVTVK